LRAGLEQTNAKAFCAAVAAQKAAGLCLFLNGGLRYRGSLLSLRSSAVKAEPDGRASAASRQLRDVTEGKLSRRKHDLFGNDVARAVALRDAGGDYVIEHNRIIRRIPSDRSATQS